VKIRWPRRRDAVDDEIRAHLQMSVRDRMDRGESRAEAEEGARRELGNIVTIKEVTREMHGFTWLTRVAQDLRYAVRLLRRYPGFSMVAVASLALGIGATTAIFQLVDAVQLRSLPVRRPSELARIRISDMEGARGNFSTVYAAVTNPIWERIRAEQQGFSGVAAWSPLSFNLADGGEVRLVQGLQVSGEFFDVLGAAPSIGRLFVEADDRRGCAVRAVLSHGFWQREFGGDPTIVGRTLKLNARPAEIVGVAPDGFFGFEVGRGFDVAVPVCAEAVLSSGGGRLDSGTDWWLVVIGRLKPGWTVERATAQLQAISPGIFESTVSPTYPVASIPRYKAFRLEAVSAGAGESQLREEYRAPLWMLLATAGIVLLIACANLANLLLARAGTRAHEIAIRLSLGASNARIVRQLLTESALLAALGAIGGLFLSGVISRTLVSFLSTTTDSVVLAIQTDWRVLGFATLLGFATCLLFGLAPALRATRAGMSVGVRSMGRGTVGTDRPGMRRALVGAQVALSLVLIAGGILFARSLANLRNFDTGFRRTGVLVAAVSMMRLETPPERRHQINRDVLERVRAIPGVSAVAGVTVVPVSGNAAGNDIWLDGVSERTNVRLNWVSPDYFRTLGIPVTAGRDFDDRDAPGARFVAIVNETLSRQILNGANPVGRHLRVEATPSMPETSYEIVGMVRDSIYRDLREDRYPTVFLAQPQSPRQGAVLRIVLHAEAPLSTIAPSVTRAMAEIDPRIAVAFRVLDQQIEDTVVREKLLAMLSTFFAGLAALLAVLGLYGIVTYNVARRTNEIGLRMALGASRGNVLSMVLREGAVLVGAGIAVGLLLALAVGRLARTLLFGIAPHDPWSLAAAALGLATLGLLSSYWPARAATRIDPTAALRTE
jgi:putative ABC transport system permease protein